MNTCFYCGAEGAVARISPRHVEDRPPPACTRCALLILTTGAAPGPVCPCCSIDHLLNHQKTKE